VVAASRYSRAVIISDRSLPLVDKETISFMGAIERANRKYKVKKVLSDNELEFRSSQLVDELNKRGIQKVYTCSYTPQSNGILEKMNHTCMNLVRTLLCHSKLPK
jgi:transposase InsO family protein